MNFPKTYIKASADAAGFWNFRGVDLLRLMSSFESVLGRSTIDTCLPTPGSSRKGVGFAVAELGTANVSISAGGTCLTQAVMDRNLGTDRTFVFYINTVLDPSDYGWLLGEFRGTVDKLTADGSWPSRESWGKFGIELPARK